MEARIRMRDPDREIDTESSPGGLTFRTRYGGGRMESEVLELFGLWRREGRLGFLDLPGDGEAHRLCRERAEELAERCDVMVCAGIGGSSLGLRALLGALGGAGRVRVADSPDSFVLSSLVDDLDPASTALTVITKSGGTAETAACFLRLHDWLSGADGRGAGSRLTAVTDPDSGDLRRLVRDRRLPSLAVPPNVGGRFSVLSPVGLFPASFAGIDTDGLLEGAAEVLRDFDDRGAGSLACMVASAWLSHFDEKPVHVFFTYSDRLRELGDWFAQLWAESLGKRHGLDGSEARKGQTPLACRGPADQHSLVQLFMEGPPDRTVTFVRESDLPPCEPLPGGFEGYPSFDWLRGRSPDELRMAEAEATETALSEAGVPVDRFELEALDARCIGAMMMTLELVTVLCGLALGVDPLDQPGVERGKLLTYRAMGRPGY